MPNITPRTASDIYYETKKKYRDISEKKTRAQRVFNDAVSKRTQYRKQLSGYETQKRSIKKRLEDIVNILAKMQGSKGGDRNIPFCISSASSALTHLDERFDQEIKVQGDVSQRTHFSDFLNCVRVDQDSNLLNAIALLRAEKNRLEALLTDLESKISDVNGRIRSEQNRINTSDFEIKGYIKTLSEYENTMRSCKRFMN